MVPPAFLLLLASHFVSPSYRRQPAQEFVQPSTYRSPSGAVELFIDPSERRGEGSASYRLSRAGEELWELELPFTWVQALVRDDGKSAGFAYDRGAASEGDLIVALLASDGSVIAEEHTPRVRSRKVHAPVLPCALSLSTADDRFVLETGGSLRQPQSWWSYRWSDGASLAKESDKPELDLLAAARVPPPPGPNEAEFPVLELAALRRIVFPWPVPLGPEGWEDPERRRSYPHHAAVDSRGNTWITEFATCVVHVFDATGKPVFDCTPAAKDFRPYRPSEWISLRGDGRLFVYTFSTLVEFAADGTRVRRRDAKDLPRWLFLPGKLERWQVGYRPIELVAADESLLRKIERGANGRWFRYLTAATTTPAGELVVLDEPTDWAGDWDWGAWVHLFDPSGKRDRSLRVPRGTEGSEIACDGERIALLRGRELLLLHVDGSALGRAMLPAEIEGPRSVSFALPGELWVFDRLRAEMHVFALPR